MRVRRVVKGIIIGMMVVVMGCNSGGVESKKVAF
ncbi:hypothetical protein BDCR2A_01447 [Borrelia duttonii CR2A]|uniref:Variable outer membrane protein n=1 Tax=Borrelia duttonii CR2A TaxID=1432657 RepID=W6TX31_9SPIR|nr:hypothetical protein BDCR2A_01447 [Borrelia duttonii CR2A]